MKWTNEKIALAVETLGKSESVKAAADTLGCGRHSIKKAFKRFDMPPPSRYVGGLPTATPLMVGDAPIWQPEMPTPEGEDPDHLPVIPEGHHVRGVSTLRGSNGAVAAQWVKTAKDKPDRLGELREALESLPEAFSTAHTVKPPQEHSNDDLMCVYPMGDPHIGMLSWEPETGVSHDLQKAEDLHLAAVDHLVDLAPPASRAVVVNLGDFFHADNASNLTSRGGNALDVDGRWAKVLRVGIRIMRRIVDKCLEKHQTVEVICEIGNHDDHTAIMLAMAMELYYEKDPRVIVDVSPDPFHWFTFGESFFGVTHGDKAKIHQLPQIMAASKPKEWGNAKFRYWLTGHVHHEQVKEYPGCVVESFRTLAPADAWHHGMGYRSGRDMRLDVYHRKFGRVNRHIVGVEQLIDE